MEEMKFTSIKPVTSTFFFMAWKVDNPVMGCSLTLCYAKDTENAMLSQDGMRNNTQKPKHGPEAVTQKT